jgi:hypothetical protein
MNKLALLSSIKLPEFIQAEYPGLVAFIEAYYRYMESLQTIDSAFLDNADADYIHLYKNIVAKGFSDPKNMSVKDFILNNKDFFSRKGTEEAFTYFFNAYFGDDVEIIRPDYLVASGAKAVGDFFFYVTKKTGTLLEHDPIVVTTQVKKAGVGGITASKASKNIHSSKPAFDSTNIGNSLYINSELVGVIDSITDSQNVVLTRNSNLDAEVLGFHFVSGTSKNLIELVKIKTLDTNTYAVYFVPPVGYAAEIGDKVTVTKNSIETFTGVVKPTPSSVVPVTKGADWRKGQIIQLPATTGGLSTICRVTKVNADTGLEGIEILQYGYPLSAEQYSISSYKSIADNSSNSNTFTQVQQDDGHYEQALTIYDNTDPVGDGVVISLTQLGGSEFFNEDYQLEDYMGTLQAYQPLLDPVKESQTQDPVVWEASYATIKVVNSAYAKEKSTYSDDSSLISNQNSRIHDNLYYQAYAYSLQTTRDINEYRSSIDLIHPAGTKFSSTLIKKFELINSEVAIINTHGSPNPDGVVANTAINNVTVNFRLGVSGVSATGVGS